MLSELNYFQTTSFLLFICLLFISFLLQNWKLGVFSDYKGIIFSQKTRPYITHEKSMNHTCSNQAVDTFWVICSTEGSQQTGRQSVITREGHSLKKWEQRCHSLPYYLYFSRTLILLLNSVLLKSEATWHLQVRAKISKPALLPVLFLHVDSSTYSVLLKSEATWHLHHHHVFFRHCWCSVHSEQH